MQSPESGTEAKCASRIQYSLYWTHLYIDHPNIQEKETKPAQEPFLFRVVVIDLRLERFSFSTISDVSFNSSSVPGHSLTRLLL